MKHEKSCGAVVFTRDDGTIRYVIIRSKGGFHGFPKGHVESNETEEQTALREIFEETGLRPTLIPGFRTTVTYQLPKKKDTDKTVVFFLGSFSGQRIRIQETELSGASLLPFDKAMEVLEAENFRRILAEADAFLNK